MYLSHIDKEDKRIKTLISRHKKLVFVKCWRHEKITVPPKAFLISIENGNFNQLTNCSPEQITHLACIDEFNERVDNLPQKIIQLQFGRVFDRPLNYLPQIIERLTVGYDYNQQINNLSKSITHIQLGVEFDQKVNKLPHKLVLFRTHLCFNQKLNKFPKTIRIIGVGGDCFDHSLDKLGENVDKIILSKKYNKPIPKRLINKIKRC